MTVRIAPWFVATIVCLAVAAEPSRAQNHLTQAWSDEGRLFDGPVTYPGERSAPEPGIYSFAKRAEETETEIDEIETDRDSFTPATTTAGRGRFILESAYSFIDNRTVLDTHSFPETVLRFGIAERIELRTHWNYEVGGGSGGVTTGEGESDFEGFRFVRESQIVYGTKIGVTEQDEWIPESAIMLLGVTPTSGVETDTAFIGTYVFGWKLPGNWKVDAAMRYSADTEERDGFNVWTPSVVAKVKVIENWTVHSEYFAQFSQHRESSFQTHYFSPGFHYLVTRNFEVGVRVGWGLNSQSANFFANAGIGYRF
jgi:hypothetical protein